MFPTREEIEPDCRMSDLDRILNDIFYSKKPNESTALSPRDY